MEQIETEFDPTEYPAEYVSITVDESIASILERVDDAWSRTPNVILVIPRGALVFNTTHDFLALGKLQGGREVRVSFASQDSSIEALARVLGFYIVEPPAGDPRFATGPLPEALADERPGVEKPTAPLPLGALTELQGWVVSQQASSTGRPAGVTTSTWLSKPVDATPPEGLRQQPWTGAQHASRSGMPPPRTKPRHTGQLVTGQLPSGRLDASSVDGQAITPPQVSPTPSGRIKARTVMPAAEASAYQNMRGLKYGSGLRRRGGWGRFMAILAVLVGLVLIAGSVYAYIYLPQGTVAVTPLNKVVNSLQAEVGVVTTTNKSNLPGRPGLASPSKLDSMDLAVGPDITATLITAPLAEEGTRPASGSRQVAHGHGQGTISFVNMESYAVSVPAGTQFKASNGVSVQITQGGTVPPTVFGQSFGKLDLPVAATVAGPDGNIAAGQIAGTWKGILQYTNSALSGGSIETVKVVTQADIDGLAADLRTKLASDLDGVIRGQVLAGQQLITQTQILANVAFEADHKAGEDGDAVHVKVTGEARAYTFDQGRLRDAVNQAMLDWMQKTIPATAGPSLDMASIQYTTPAVEAIQDGKVVYSMSVSARVAFSLTPSLAIQIRDLVKGREIRQARNLIVQTYGSYVNPASIEARVLWFSIDKLPSDPARIDVESSAGPSLTVPGATSPVRQLSEAGGDR